jgi:hypothetical protein
MNTCISKEIENKKVLFIPIYSMRSYKTGKYKMLNDGNMARILSKIYSSNVKSAHVLIPEQYEIEDFEDLNNFVERLKINVTFLQVKCYGENANETRNTLRFINDKELNLLERCNNYDVIISEPNMTTYALMESKIKSKLIYWCVASKTSEICPWFVEEFADMDYKIAQNVKTAVLTKTQMFYLKGKSFVDTDFYKAELFDYKTIFFPFRLSDKSYKAKIFRKIIEELKSEGINNFKVLFTDPNNSGIFEEDGTFVKVDSSKDVYLSILKSKPIIPYFEDSNNMLHISIFEFDYYGCKIIMYENDNIKPESAVFIKNDSEIKEALKNALS